MKFKVGDRVRGIKNNVYGVTNQDMYKGEIVRIREDRYIDVKILEHRLKEEIGREYIMLDPKYFMLEKYTYEDLKKSPTGTKVTFENGNILAKTCENKFENETDISRIVELVNFTDRYYGKIIKIEEPEYKTVYEAKPEILDKTEKRYLSNFIRPFKDSVETIRRLYSPTKEKDYIQIRYKDDRPTNLPYFESDTMYKKMEINKNYTLEELGL